jgi:hypothetical protein
MLRSEAGRLKCAGPLRNQLFDDVAVNVGQSKIAAGMAEGQLCMIEAKQLQKSRMQIVDVDRIFDRLETKIISRAVDISAAHTSTRQPHCEAVMVVIATVDFAGIRARCG